MGAESPHNDRSVGVIAVSFPRCRPLWLRPRRSPGSLALSPPRSAGVSRPRPGVPEASSQPRPAARFSVTRTVRHSRLMRSVSAIPSLFDQSFEHGAGEDTGDDVRPDFAENVDFRIAVWWEYRYLALAVRRSNERSCVLKLSVSPGNVSEHTGIGLRQRMSVYKYRLPVSSDDIRSGVRTDL